MPKGPSGDLETPAPSMQGSNRCSAEVSVSAKVNLTQNVDLEDVHAFFSDDDGGSFISSSDESLSRIATRSSAATVATAVPGPAVMELSLSNVCKYISEHRSLQEAEIVSTECHAQNLGGITHRFLVLELWRPNRKKVWLRLDRRREENVSLIKFLASFGVTKANDRAMMAASKDLLTGQARAENRQILGTPPTLNELRILLNIIREEIVQYRLWPENCWFFCSLIQQHLNGAQSGWFENGNLKYARIAQGVRLSVATRFWMTKTTAREPATSKPMEPKPNSASPSTSRVVVNVDPQVLEALRMFASKESFPPDLQRGASDVLMQIDQMQTIQSLTTLSESGPCREVINKLKTLGEMFDNSHRFAETVVALRAAVMLHKDLCIQDPSGSESSLAKLMIRLSNALYHSKCFAEACAVDEEAIPILSKLYENDPDEYRADLADLIDGYHGHLYAMQRLEEACVAAETCVGMRRELYTLNPEKHARDLVSAFDSWSRLLIPLNRNEEARDLLEEAIPICREWFKTDETFCASLTILLHQHAHVLYGLGLYVQACEVGEESITLGKQLSRQELDKYYYDMKRSMNNHAICLRTVGRIEEAKAIEKERDYLMSSVGCISGRVIYHH